MTTSLPDGPPAPSGFGDRFFAWTTGIGVVRGDGWMGGVAAGLAARLRIDPLIVRGILVVVGLFGFPVLFLYAIAWAVLPDLDERIPLRNALRGRFSSSQVGIVALAAFGLIPAPVPMLVGAPTFWSVAGAGGGLTAIAVLLFAVGVLIVAALVVIIARAALHAPPVPTSENPVSDPPTAVSRASDTSAGASGSGPDVADADPVEVDVAGFAASTSTLDSDSRSSSEADAPSSSERSESKPGEDDAYAAWREQHAAWKMQDDAWRRDQQDAARAARDRARAERQAQAATFSAEAAERRRLRRATNPRAPFAFVATAVGIAIIAGAVVALQRGTELAAARGFFAAALVTALGMVVAGVARRRSGFLAFTTLILLVGGLTATATPTLQAMHVGSFGISNLAGAQTWPASAPFVQPFGDLSVTIVDTGAPTEPIHVDKRAGWTFVSVESGVALTVDLTVPVGYVSVFDQNGEVIDLASTDGFRAVAVAGNRMRYTGTLVSGSRTPTTPQTLVIDQQSGGVQIQTAPSEEDSR